jgi:hypothetical protein
VSDEPAPGSFEAAALSAMRTWLGAQHLALATLPHVLADLLLDCGDEATECTDASAWLLASAAASPGPYQRLLACLSEADSLGALN